MRLIRLAEKRFLWLRRMAEAGFPARAVVFEHSEIEPGSCETFIGVC